jgi:hypothetical protein
VCSLHLLGVSCLQSSDSAIAKTRTAGLHCSGGTPNMTAILSMRTTDLTTFNHHPAFICGLMNCLQVLACCRSRHAPATPPKTHTTLSH